MPLPIQAWTCYVQSTRCRRADMVVVAPFCKRPRPLSRGLLVSGYLWRRVSGHDTTLVLHPPRELFGDAQQ